MNIEEASKKHVDTKILRRLKMFAVIIFIMTMVLIYDIITSHINILYVIIGLLIGAGVGIIIGRIFTIEWHVKDSKVISRLDLIGGIVLAVYIILSIFRHWIFAHWFKGAILSTFTVSFVEGVMFGRILSLRFFIKKILTEQGKI